MQPRLVCLLLIGMAVKIRMGRGDEISRWALGLRSLLKECPPAPWTSSGHRRFLPALRHCLQHRALVALDSLLMDDVIPLLDGINLVRFKESNSTDDEFDSDQMNNFEEIDGREGGQSWHRIVVSRLSSVFRTHVLKIDMDQVARATGLSATTPDEEGSGDEIVQGRRRRHKRKGMMPMMMMGFLVMGSILIPMGFQFLAVLGGKALILAKMALMLSSIQGLKKIATSGVNYGLYHSGAPEGWHERSRQEPETPIELPYHGYPPPVPH